MCTSTSTASSACRGSTVAAAARLGGGELLAQGGRIAGVEVALVRARPGKRAKRAGGQAARRGVELSDRRAPGSGGGERRRRPCRARNGPGGAGRRGPRRGGDVGRGTDARAIRPVLELGGRRAHRAAGCLRRVARRRSRGCAQRGVVGRSTTWLRSHSGGRVTRYRARCGAVAKRPWPARPTARRVVARVRAVEPGSYDPGDQPERARGRAPGSGARSHATSAAHERS